MTYNRTILTRMFSERAGYDTATPHGAEKLQKDIADTTGELLSVNTLKRITGVIPYSGEPRLSTLEILARYLGFPSAQAMDAVLGGSTSDFNLPPGFINSATMKEGQRIRLSWAPGRTIVIRHSGAGKYDVEESVNSKLQAGDILNAGYLAEGYPLIIKEVWRDGNNLGEYNAASEGGLTEVEIL